MALEIKVAIRPKTIVLAIIFMLVAKTSFSQAIISASDKMSTSAIDTAFINRLYQQALNEIAQQDISSAENTLNQILKSDPKHDEARFALIRIYFLQKKLTQAENLILAGTKVNPDQPLFWEALSDLYKETKNYKAILPVFEELIRLKPKELKSYLDKAYTYSLLKDYKSALSVYSHAERQFGENETITSKRFNVYLEQGQNIKAIKEAKQYLKKHTDKVSAYLLVASIYLDIKEPKNALDLLNTAETKFPDDPSIYLSKADTYQELKDTTNLINEFKKAFYSKNLELNNKIQILFKIYQELEPEQAQAISNVLCPILIEIYPREPNVYGVYGDILLQQNNIDGALIEFQKALQLNPNLPMIWENVLQIQVSAGNYLAAQKEGAIALTYAPQNPMLLLYTGYSYLLDKKYEKARPYLESALNNTEEGNEALQLQIYSSLGDLYNSLGLFNVSNAAYEEALAIDSNNTYVLNNYAYYLSVRKENLAKAALYSKRSIELLPGTPSFEDTYAWILFQQEDYKDALIWIENAITSSEGSPSSNLIEHQGDILYKLGKEKEALTKWENAKAIALANGQKTEKLELKIKTKKYVD